MIEIIIGLVANLIFIIVFFWVVLFMLKYYSKRRKKKRVLKQIKVIEHYFKRFLCYVLFVGNLLAKLFISVFLAIGSKPLIYKFNYSLGEGYATFASYAIAILLYIIIPNFYELKKPKKDEI